MKVAHPLSSICCSMACRLILLPPVRSIRACCRTASFFTGGGSKLSRSTGCSLACTQASSPHQTRLEDCILRLPVCIVQSHPIPCISSPNEGG